MAKCCEFCGRAIEGFKRNTRKYCDDNCKQLAYYARQGMNWGRPELSGSGDLPLSVKPYFTSSDKNNADLEKETFVEQKTITLPIEKQVVEVKPVHQIHQNPPALQPYRKVQSSLLNAIERNREQVEKYFEVPEHYWTQDTISCVKWVTVRVRCLLENLLRLSTLGNIDNRTIQQLFKALSELKDSVYFRCLPMNYPFTKFILELKEKFQGISLPAQSRRISFRLSPERKAQFMAYRFVILHFVPKAKFSQLDFSDGIRKQFDAEFQRKTQG
jgi:hypothetical protein